MFPFLDVKIKFSGAILLKNKESFESFGTREFHSPEALLLKVGLFSMNAFKIGFFSFPFFWKIWLKKIRKTFPKDFFGMMTLIFIILVSFIFLKGVLFLNKKFYLKFFKMECEISFLTIIQHKSNF
jgi:hypothetical protein